MGRPRKKPTPKFESYTHTDIVHGKFYHLRGDSEIFFTRSMHGHIITFHNGSVSAYNKDREAKELKGLTFDLVPSGKIIVLEQVACIGR